MALPESSTAAFVVGYHDDDANTDDNSTLTSGLPETGTVFDESKYIRQYLGWRYRHIGESVSLTAVYVVIMVAGLVGNISTCIVIGRNRAMHTPTNYYLLSLAVSDVLTLFLGRCLLSSFSLCH
jgi:hypothetical protein